MLTKKPEAQIFAVIIEDNKKALRIKEYVNPLPLLPKEYHEYIDVFSREDLDILSSYCHGRRRQMFPNRLSPII